MKRSAVLLAGLLSVVWGRRMVRGSFVAVAAGAAFAASQFAVIMVAVIMVAGILAAGLAASIAAAPTPALAQRATHNLLAEFPVPTGFDGRIQFWIDVFAKYGKFHRVFHHRDHPEIVYSVLDFSELEDDYQGKKLEALRDQAIAEEEERIKEILLGFADGRAPRSEFEKRLQALFKKYTSGSRAAYLEATEEKQIRNQSGIRERFRDGLVRSGRYLYAIERIFADQGLPLGLSRLPLVESSFDYRAYSSVGAAGIWQFMRSTGKRYMRVTPSIDERRDPIISTRAAAQYLRNSYNRTNEWGLAVTSYNHGLQGILNAANQSGSRDLGIIVRNYKGSSFGFASSNFYAEFLAALHVEQYSERYFPGLQREGPWYFDEVKLGRPARLADVANLTGAEKDEIASLNLAFGAPIVKNAVMIPSGTVVKVPPGRGRTLVASVSNSSLLAVAGSGSAASLHTAIANSMAPQTGTPQNGTPQNGSLGAGSSGTGYAPPASSLAVANALKSPIVGEGPPVTPASVRETARAAADATYVMRSNQTVSSKNGQSDTTKAQAGKSPAASAKAPARMESYTVKSGESLGAIANKLGVSTAQLMQSNGIRDPRKVKAGSKLIVPGAKAAKPTSELIGDQPQSPQAISSPAKSQRPSAAVAAAKGPVQVQPERARAGTYKVESGDTLGAIAGKLGVSLQQLLAANPDVNPKRIKPGMTLRAPGGDSSGQGTGGNRAAAQVASAADDSAIRSDAGVIGDSAAGSSTAPSKQGTEKVDAANKASAKSESPPAQAAAKPSSPGNEYTVEKGDTLGKIGKKFGLPTASLLELNPGIDPKRIRPGVKVRIK